MTMDAFANAMPFVEFVHALGEHPEAGRNPIFEVRFALQNHPVPEVSLPNLSARLSMRSTGTPRFPTGVRNYGGPRRTGSGLAFSREFVFAT